MDDSIAAMKPVSFRFISRDHCPACGSAEVRPGHSCRFDRPPISTLVAGYYGIEPALLAAGEYRVDRCGKCRTLFQAEVGDPALLDALYTDWAPQVGGPVGDPQYEYDISNPAKSRDGHELMAAAAFLGRPLGELRTLDYGMGWASWARIAASLGCRSFGTDLAAEKMGFAERHGVVSIAEEAIADHRFDFINMEQALEHLVDPSGTVSRLAASLAPGGVLKISVPSQRGVARLLGRLAGGADRVDYREIKPVMPLEHVNCFTRSGLKALGRRFGLEPVHPRPHQSFAFLGTPGTLDVRDPRRLAKELARPIYQLLNPGNLYFWFRRTR
jgi:hypothetical protein